jgi:putative oxidoreductase
VAQIERAMNNDTSFCARISPYFLFLMRIVIALLFMQHGGQKLLGYPPGGHGLAPVNSLIGLAGLLELAGGAFIFIGFLTRPTAFLLSGEMAVAYFKAHALNGHGLWPVQNGGELAVIYCFVFLYLAVAGAGALGLDGCRKKS